jgi:hypothetical protein
VDKTALVAKNELDLEGRILEALRRAKIPVTLFDSNFVPQLDQWQLVVATPWYDSKGPRQTYARIIDALSQAGIYQDVPMRRLFVKSPEDPFVKALERELKFPREGSIHITAYKTQPRGYSVIFAPYTGPGGAVPSKHITSDDDLRDFLEKHLGIRTTVVTDALSELRRKGSTSIPNTQLTARKAKRLGLA